MVNGNFDPADVQAIANAANAVTGHWQNGAPQFGGESAAFRVFVRLCHARRWTTRVASDVWAAARPVVDKIEDDDIPF